MSSRKQEMWRWWSKFDQITQLADIMAKTLAALIDDYLALSPVDSCTARPIGFDEYVMHRAVNEVPDLLRLCPGVVSSHMHANTSTHVRAHTHTHSQKHTQFFELMDVAQLLEGNTETRSRDAFVKMAPILHPLASTAGIAGIVVSTSERAFARTHARARTHTHTHTAVRRARGRHRQDRRDGEGTIRRISGCFVQARVCNQLR